MLEVKELLTKWNSIIMPNFENEAALLEMELKKRQQNEVVMFRQQVEQEQSSQRIYYSTDVLDMQRKIEVLGNNGNYKDAKIVKKQLKERQKRERYVQTESSKEKLLLRSTLLAK